MKAGVLFGQGTPPHASYLFKHALVQDAAYSTLLRDARRVLHARIGNALNVSLLMSLRASLSYWRVTTRKPD